MGFGGCQNKDDMWRWLLQRLEQGIGGFFGKHVDFIDNIDLITRLVRGIVDFLAEVSYFVNTAIAGGIYFNDIKGTTFGYGLADSAVIARFAFTVVEAVDRLGQAACGTRFARTPWATEEIGVGNAVVGEGIQQGLGHVFLPDHLCQKLRAPLAIKDLRSHITYYNLFQAVSQDILERDCGEVRGSLTKKIPCRKVTANNYIHYRQGKLSDPLFKELQE